MTPPDNTHLRLLEAEYWLHIQRNGLLEQLRNIDHMLAVLRGEKEPELAEVVERYRREMVGHGGKDNSSLGFKSY